MKYADIKKLHDAKLITDEQGQKIIEYFHLKEDLGNKFLAIISIIGAVLITAGIALLISANWNEIPRGVKIASGIFLMIGFHGGGWWLRENRKTYPKTGEALHLIGSGLFLANIALLGQIYNIVSRPPNAFLLWWIGIAALPWLLRSKAQHVLLLMAFGIWFGLEVNERDSFIFCDSARQVLLYSLLGAAFFGIGNCLRLTNFSEFAGVTEKFGLLAMLIFFFPLTWKDFLSDWHNAEIQKGIFPGLALIALPPLAIGIKNLRNLTSQWRWTWFFALFGMMVFMTTIWFDWLPPDPINEPRYFYHGNTYANLLGTVALFVFCLLQIQVGLQERSPFLVNLGVSFVALDILAAYFDLFGSMTRTGVMFLSSGIFLILFGIYLETKRRKLMKQITSRAEGLAP